MNQVQATYKDLTNRGYRDEEAKAVIRLAVKRLQQKHGKNYAGELVMSRERFNAAVEEAKCFKQFGQW